MVSFASDVSTAAGDAAAGTGAVSTVVEDELEGVILGAGDAKAAEAARGGATRDAKGFAMGVVVGGSLIDAEAHGL